ncbi:MAG: hypothetical protein HYX53_10205 [Chloroflexi bacterium]|nr:hypothetical protein [Chloroflexota bacterium]
MPFVDDETAQAYREAWEAWIKQIEHVNRVFLEGEKLRPDQIKGLFNREARAKTKYDAARRRLLGIEESPLGDGGGADLGADE